MGTSNSTSKISVESVGGISLLKSAYLVAGRLTWCIDEAERLKGSPASTPEIIVVFCRNVTNVFPRAYITAFLLSLYREDRYYADKDHCFWSLTGPDGSEERKTYMTFSERFRSIYPGYMLDNNMRIVARPETPVINLK